MSIKHMYYRLYQGVFRVAVNFLDWTPPKIISGPAPSRSCRRSSRRRA